MRILQINIFGNLSTGRIATDLYKAMKKQGHDGILAFARNNTSEDVPHICIGSNRDVTIHGIGVRLTDRAGFFSRRATAQLIERIKEYKPDIIHLHNLHGYYLNIKLLFDYLKETQIPVVWTLHDCWAYTGHCCYYSAANCDKWLNGCSNCPQKKQYPASLLLDQSKRNYREKRDLFSGINMILVPVSFWLGNEVKKSFLKDYPIEVIQNGIDLSVFKPRENDIKRRYGIEGKKMILAVSSSWHDPRKGLDDIIELSHRLPSDCRVVIVGIGKKEKEKVPESIICIDRTDSVDELAEFYSAADVFVNASIEETFGLPTVEAMACGTPVIVYNATAVPEVVTEKCGYVVEKHDIDAIVRCIQKCESLDINDIIQNAGLYTKERMMDKYLQVYMDIGNKQYI